MLKDLFDVIGGTVNGGKMQDFADKINSVITVLILLTMTTLVAFKTYIFSPIECFTTTAPAGTDSDFAKYVSNFCWINGTIPLQSNEKTPGHNEWYSIQRTVINYYPWIPIILALQCGLFYLPQIIWKEYCSSKAGIDLENIISSAQIAGCAPLTTRNENIKDIAVTIEVLFYLHRDNRQGIIADVKRKMSQKLPLLIWGKRSGNSIFGVYLVIKMLYLINGFGQIFLMSRVLQLNSTFLGVFIDVFRFLFHGQDWQATLYFPRVTYCRVDGIRALGTNNNAYIAQCVLTINILNEKIYIFLFMWIFLLIIITLLYTLHWIYILSITSPKRKLVKKYLKGRNIFKKIEEPLMEKFIAEFLRLDGIFLLKMIRMNCGDVLTASLVEQLFIIYKNKYRYVDFSKAEICVQNENFAFLLEPGEQKASKNNLPSAPKNNIPMAPKKEIFL